jgi:uroporphyrin-III C-methyltransferase
VSGGRGEAGPRVAIVGAGPGDPELLTLKAARWIAEAEDLLVDALVPAAVYQGTSARIVYVGKRAGRPSVGQRRIEEILVRLAKAGRRVVRLKGGDPCLFGRGGEEMRALEAAGVAYELVPGVSSALAAPAAAGIPVTDRGAAEGVTVVTGHRRAGHPEPVPVLPAYVAERTVVVLMGLGSLGTLVEGALALGYPSDLPAAVVSKATLPEQRTVAARLAELPGRVEEAGLETPATIVIGWVAAGAVEKARSAAEAITEVAAGLVPAGRSVAARAAGR